MGPAAKALLLALAEDLDAVALGPLADQLEELGDARAGKVRHYRDHPAAAFGEDGRCVHPPGATCRAVLSLFPDGPRWRRKVQVLSWGEEKWVEDSGGPWLTPRDARECPASGNTRVAGPLWPTPADRR